jgi:hypothetical protein
MSNIDQTLTERGGRYGTYKDNAQLTQELLAVVMAHPNWRHLSYPHRETIHMIFHKLSRLVNGDPDYFDSWHDIEGYAKLQADLCPKGDK